MVIEQVQSIPTTPGLVGVNSARHPEYSGNVHEVECQVEPDQEKPEVPLAERFVQHSSGDFWVPVIERGEEGKQNPADECVMKVRDDEIRQAKLPIEGRRGQHDAGETGNQELEEKPDAEQHRRLELNSPAPHGAEPIEDLDSRGNTDDHRGDGEKAVGVRVHSDREHVVRPYAHADEGDADRRRRPSPDIRKSVCGKTPG